MKSTLLSTFFILLMFTANSQFPKYRVISIPVFRHGIQMREPWTGGMDSPQFSECDLNNDGIPDLFVFDRVAGRVYTYINNGYGGNDTMYSYAPQYESLFPTNLSNWALMRDYNNDGIPDLFTWVATSSGPGTQVFKGSIVNGLLQLNLVCPAIEYEQPPYTPYVLTLVTDLPIIADVNGDGDLDIIDYNFSGTSINYFENQAAENPGNPAYSIDSFKYNLVTSCWGNVSQNLNNNSMTLDVSCKGGTDPFGQPGGLRHAGNSLYSITDPVTGNFDILNGNIGFDNLFLLRNCSSGSESASICEWDSVFPPAPCANPMFMPDYPAAFGIHINSPALQDVLVAPNVQAPYFQGGGSGRNVKNVQYYQNMNDTTCWYSFQTDSFIVDHMLDFGTESVGLFYDFDGDGLTDIVVGGLGYFEAGQPNQTGLAVYRNIGTAIQPAFEEISLDYDSLSRYNLQGFSPAFGDMNGDGKKDLIVGDALGYLYYFQNEADTGSSFPVMTASQYAYIKTGLNAAPFIYDVNGDSLNDLIIGQEDGTIWYYWNLGTKDSAAFNVDSVNTNFGNINVASCSTCKGYSVPFIRTDSAGNMLLYVGSLTGHIFEYLIDPTQLESGSFTLLDSDLLHQNTGLNTTISIADLTNSGKMEYLVGTAAGGLLMYSDSLWDSSVLLKVDTTISSQKQFKVYPNPANDNFICSLGSVNWTNPSVEVFDILGKKDNIGITWSINQITINAAELESGFYVVRITDSGSTYTGKVLIVR